MATGLAIILGLATIPTVRAEHADVLKAAFVLNFMKFAEWHSATQTDTNAPLVIAVIGDGQLVAALKTVLDGKAVLGHKVAVQVFRDAAEWKKADSPCHAIFVTSTAQSAWGEIRAGLVGRSVLTIGEAPGFCAQGGMLNLFEKENRIRFEANPGAVEKEKLKLRSELLKLATIVKTEEGGKQ